MSTLVKMPHCWKHMSWLNYYDQIKLFLLQIESIIIKDPHEFQMKKWLKPVVKNGKYSSHTALCLQNIYQ